MTTPLLLDCMLHVYVGYTRIPFISKSLVLVDLYFLVMCLVGDLLLFACFSTKLVTRSKV